MLTALLPASGEFPPISPILPRRQFPTNCNLCAYLFIGGDTAIICNPQCSLLSCVVILSAAVADISLIAAFLLLPPPPCSWTVQCHLYNMDPAMQCLQYAPCNSMFTMLMLCTAVPCYCNFHFVSLILDCTQLSGTHGSKHTTVEKKCAVCK